MKLVTINSFFNDINIIIGKNQELVEEIRKLKEENQKLMEENRNHKRRIEVLEEDLQKTKTYKNRLHRLVKKMKK
jgi:FtsZ-binding cell division protein ZapB